MKAKQLADLVPTNWTDELLSGPDAVLGKPPWDCRDIERLLLRLRSRIATAERKRRPRKAR